MLSDNAIFVGDVPINHVSFDRISEIGLTKYLSVVKLLSLKEDEIEGLFKEKEVHTMMALVWILTKIEPDFWDDLCIVCFELFGKEPYLLEDPARITFGRFEINEENWCEIASIIRARNCLGASAEVEEEDNPADEATRALLKRRNEMRKKLAKKKGSSEESITYVDLVSIYSSSMKLPLSEVMKYDIYQLNNQFRRAQMYETYQTQIEALLHGAKNEDMDLKHYARKLIEEL